MDEDRYADEGAVLEFEEDPVITSRRPRRLMRIIGRILPLLLLTALLAAVAEPSDLALLFHRSPAFGQVRITIVCDVPWAIIRVDGRGAAIRCTQSGADTLPMARLVVDVGQHTLMATAEGFAPYPIYIVAHPDTPGLYLTQFTLTPSGTRQALDAVNAYFASAYSQDVAFPAALWRMLGLRAPPTGPFLLLSERFEAVALDSYEPFYSETTYQRPITPEQGTVGIAAVVVEHVTINNGCSATSLIERRAPVLYMTRASVTLSARPDSQRWMATSPYALNPAADIYTAPDVAATPASPGGLMELVAHADLADLLGRTPLAGALTVTPLTNATDWAAGVVLTLSGARQSQGIASGAIWLYTGGRLIALTAAAQALSPGVPATATIPLDTLRASLANQPTRLCDSG